MAEVLSFLPNISGGLIGQILSWGGLLLLLAAAVAAYWWYNENNVKYNKTVVVMRIGANNTKKYFFDKAKYFVNKEGVDGWKLQKLGKVVDVPPDEVLEITQSGKTVAHCLLDANEQITWCAVPVDYEKYKKEGLGTSYEPITTQSKSAWAYQQKYNQKLRGLDAWKENMPLIVGAGALIVMLGIVLFFLPETFEAAEENSKAQAEAARAIAQAIDKLDLALSNQQQIREEQIRDESDPGGS